MGKKYKGLVLSDLHFGAIDADEMKDELRKNLFNLLDLRGYFDYIIIDCPPNLGILTTNALAASDSVLIPIQCEYYSLEGVNQLLHTVLKVQQKVNPNLSIEGVLLIILLTLLIKNIKRS